MYHEPNRPLANDLTRIQEKREETGAGWGGGGGAGDQGEGLESKVGWKGAGRGGGWGVCFHLWLAQ